MRELAVVFDGAGVLYAPFRIIKDINRGITKRSRVSGLSCTDRLERGAMAILKTRYDETLAKEEDSKLLSEVMKAKKIEIRVVYKREGIDDEEVLETILNDRRIKLRDVHETMGFLMMCDILPVVGIALIVEMASKTIRYLIAGGIKFFPGTRKLLKELSQMGCAVFIASGDRIEPEEISVYLPEVPPENIFGMMTPEDKRDLVRKLKDRYRVIMVGDDRNDYLAFCESDIAVLSLQEAADRPGEIFEVADFRINNIEEVKGIIEEMEAHKCGI